MADSEEVAKYAENQQPDQAVSFFRKPLNQKTLRKRRSIHNEDDDEEEDSKIQRVLLPIQKNTLTFKPDNRPFFQFESSKEIQVQNDNKATSTLQTETDFSKDARAIRERALKRKGSTSSDKLYKGINNYNDYKAGFRREQTIASEKAGGSHGPLWASAHIRVSTRFDYPPDICKDYKETGYCGYGDSCKFMHDRGDCKSGWQLEKEWEEAEKAKKMRLAAGEDADDAGEDGANLSGEDDESSLPFVCFICRNPFVDPVVSCNQVQALLLRALCIEASCKE